ncbi:hypothetical protein C8J56DRAFT_1101178 [Mycena floridula]|nr:hypothetical protein C8J56DRAFT_1101178 [Mycena floridula]
MLEPELNSNNPPLRDIFVEKKSRAIFDLDKRIDALHIELDTLVLERQQHEHELEEYQSTIHPIQRVPPEIWGEVFLTFLSDDFGSKFDESSLSMTATPWVVSQVSQAWRDISMSFPKLWSTIRLIIDDEHPVPNHSILVEQIERAGSYRLSVSVFGRQKILSTDPLIQTLFNTSSRWCRFDLLIRRESCGLLSSIAGSLDHLESFALWLLVNGEMPKEALGIFEIQSLPRLASLGGTGESLLQLGLPLEQITQLSIDEPWDKLPMLLVSMPNLRDVSLYLKDPPASRMVIPICHNQIQRLRLINANYVPDFLDTQMMDLPALRVLEVDYPVRIVGFLERSEALLEELSIPQIVDDPLMLVKVMSGLKVLQVDVLDSEIVQFIISTPLPLLKYIKLTEESDMGDIESLKAARPLVHIWIE